MPSKDKALKRNRTLTIIGLGRVIELAVQESGLSSARFRALSGIEVGVTSSGLLARFLNVTPSTVTTVMDGLVADGHVVRTSSAQDRRRVNYELTEAGIASLEEANTVALSALDAMAEFVDPTERDLALTGLDQWTRAIDARREHWGDTTTQPPGATP